MDLKIVEVTNYKSVLDNTIEVDHQIRQELEQWHYVKYFINQNYSVLCT